MTAFSNTRRAFGSRGSTPSTGGSSELSSGDVWFSTGGNIPTPIPASETIADGFTGVTQRTRGDVTYYLLRRDTVPAGELAVITTTSLTEPLDNIIL